MKNEKFPCLIILVFFLLIFFKTSVFAESSYVLPYPSSMPGSLSYKLHLIYENISKYWYFGDFGQFDYNLKMTDKYLVESKTLFEYKQYLLGYKALQKSDQYFISALPNLIRAERNGKNSFQGVAELKGTAQKHTEVLSKLQQEVPQNFIWTPEDAKPTNLNLKDAIDKSIEIRNKYL